MGPELAIAGWFASAAISQLIGLAFSYIKEQPVWLKMKEELEELHAALVPIRAVVEKVEKLQIINDCTPAQEAWLWQLKDAVDEANDVLDELEYHKLEEDVQSGGEKVRATASNYTNKIIRSTAFSFKHAQRLKKKLKKAVKNLLRVADSAGDFLKLHDLSNEYEKRQQQIRAHESGCFLTEDKVFGREKEKEKIVEWLKKPGSGEHESSVKKNVTLLPIVGMPGIGKTTLAQLVYGEGSFDLKMWVCVSNYFDVKVIMKKMIQEADITDRQAEAVSTLQKIIAEKLESKKFLLVLDDVWNDGDSNGDRKKWKDLLAPLQYGKQGSKILLTTRMNSVAEMLGKVLEGTEEPMTLQGIEWSEYLSLFNKHAFDGVDTGDHEKLQLIGEQIAKNLGQSPLLARTVGGMLNSNLSVEFWNEVLENGVFNSIQNEDFQPILRLNYIHLSPQLQQCFRYCSIFPQDHAFQKDELVRMWMAVGLIQQDDKKRRPEDIGGEYFDSLLRKSFFNLLQAYQFTYYVIHDLLHEMICSVSEGECLGVDYSKPNPRNIPTTLRHLFIMVDDPRVLSKVPPLENLHSLVLTTHGWDDILNKVLKGFKNLRVLKLESFGERKLESKLESLNAIGDLKHLRYLHLHMLVEGTQLPKSVCKLYHLQTMIVPSSDPSIGSIGKDMRSLINLRHLIILPLEEITTIVEGGKLTALQELDEFYVRKENGCNIGALKHLRELRGTLSIRNLENVESYEDAMVGDLLNKKHLRKLQLEWVYDSNSTPEVAAKVIDGLQPHSSLEDLEIFGYNGADPPRWLATQDLNMLGSITLRSCKNLKLLPPFEKLPFLKSLFLDDMKALTEVSFTTFPKLEVLNLWNIPQLEKWSGDGRWFPCLKSLSLRDMRALTEVSFTTFEKLEDLDFGYIPQLEKWSGVGDGPWFPCLKNLTITDCSVLEQLPPLPHGMEALQISEVGLTTLPRLRQCQNNDCGSPSPSKPGYLMIRSCPKLTSLAGCLLQHTDHFMDVEILSIHKCKELVHLPVEGFQKFKSLRSLYISECPRLQRHNAPHDDFFLPSSVENIMISDCGEMDASLLGAMQHLAYLSELFLSECTTITSLPSAKVFRGLKKLHQLIIRECRELTSLGGLQALTSLKRLGISGCPKLVEAAAAVMPPLTSDPDERAADGSSLSLDMLELDDPSLLHLEPLRSLTSVRHLELRDCSRPTSLSEEWLLQVRGSLQQLSLLQAVSLRFLPVSLKELCSLQVLELSRLPLLQSLPELPNSLKTLHIHDCNSKLEDLLLGQGWNTGLEHCFGGKTFTRNEAHN